MVMITNDDRPGVIGTVGMLLGDAGINIADMDVGRSDTSGPGRDADRQRRRSSRPCSRPCAAAPGILNVVALTS